MTKTLLNWERVAQFLQRELGAFECLLSTLDQQSDAMRQLNISSLERVQLTLEKSLAEAENAVFERVKWQQERMGSNPLPTWRSLLEQAPAEQQEKYMAEVERLRWLGEQVRRRLDRNHKYARGAKSMVQGLRRIEGKVRTEKTELYTARGLLRTGVGVSATIGGNQ
jgi:hypothetical protein